MNLCKKKLSAAHLSMSRQHVAICICTIHDVHRDKTRGCERERNECTYIFIICIVVFFFIKIYINSKIRSK